MKKCNYCGEEIQDKAKKCRHCGEWLEETNNTVSSQSTAIGTKTYNNGFDFGEYFKGFITLLFNHNGRINRGEYISGYILAWGIFMLVFMFAMVGGSDDLDSNMGILMTVSTIGAFALYYMMFVLTIKRFHDIDKSGWFSLVPFYNFIAPLFFEGDKKGNRFGEDIKDGDKLINMKSIFILDGIIILLYIAIIALDSL